jgi:hypothetical protein
MTQGTVTIKDNSIRLPEKLRGNKSWNDSKLLMFMPPKGDTLILKRISKPVVKLSFIAKRNKLAPISRTAINKEIAAYRTKGK